MLCVRIEEIKFVDHSMGQTFFQFSQHVGHKKSASSASKQKTTFYSYKKSKMTKIQLKMFKKGLSVAIEG